MKKFYLVKMWVDNDLDTLGFHYIINVQTDNFTDNPTKAKRYHTIENIYLDLKHFIKGDFPILKIEEYYTL